MVKCIVVDDEAGAIEVLSSYINDTPGLELTASFRDPLEAWKYISNSAVDLAFVDIDMPGLNGLQLAKLVRNKATAVIFCTAYAEYAAESYNVSAIDYLLKPIPFERFINAIEKYHSIGGQEQPVDSDRQGLQDKSIFIKSGPILHQVDLEEIKYIKKDGHYVEFHTTGKQLLSRMNMDELLDRLPGDGFLRVHKSYVVSKKWIKKIEKQFVSIDGREIPIGDHFRQEFFRKINYSGK